jgi:hypothetical protein
LVELGLIDEPPPAPEEGDVAPTAGLVDDPLVEPVEPACVFAPEPAVTPPLDSTEFPPDALPLAPAVCALAFVENRQITHVSVRIVVFMRNPFQGRS